MPSDAYLSSTFLSGDFSVYRDRQTFPVSLIAYDTIYVHQAPNNIPWVNAAWQADLRKGNTEKLFLEGGKREKFAKQFLGEVVDFSLLALGLLMDGNPKVYKLISKNLVDIRLHPLKEIREFFYDFFDPHVKSNEFKYSRAALTQAPSTQESDKILIPIFNSFLLMYMQDYLEKEFYLHWDDIFDLALASYLANEVYICSYLSKKHSIAPILTMNDIEFRVALRKMDPIPISPDEFVKKHMTNLKTLKPSLVKKYFKERTVQGLLKNKGTSKGFKDVNILLENHVPNFSSVPVYEIAKLKHKDKFKSIGKLVEDISADKKRISSIEISHHFVEQLWKLGKILSPSIGEVLIGLLGEVPIPLPVNPIGILSSINDIQNFIKFKKEYAWFIVLSDLRGIASRNRKLDNK